MLSKSDRRMLVLLAAGGLALALALGCAPAPERTPTPSAVTPLGEPKLGGTLVWAFNQEPTTYDVLLNRGVPNMEVANLVYDRLLRWKRGPDVGYAEFVPVPMLAERWEQPDDVTYMFHLRKGVKWQNLPPLNGRELTAEDVAYSLEKIRTDKGALFRDNLASVDKIEAVDKYTLKVTNKYPFGGTINYIASVGTFVFPRELLDAKDG
ncbi:MAG TPA: ABC transporter substrate-binding protein, partial [Dehalococcoidia bacterium]|nr:ABC transporter substrate-binding protein [Dehalococcoidia bacterium]